MFNYLSATGRGGTLLLVLELEVLDVDGFHPGRSLLHRRLLEILAGTHLTDSAGLLELSLEFLQSALDVLAFLYGNYDHN